MPHARAQGNVQHKTSTGLQIIELNGDGSITKVLIDSRTRATFPMDDTQWRELESYIIALHGIAARELVPVP